MTAMRASAILDEIGWTDEFGRLLRVEERAKAGHAGELTGRALLAAERRLERLERMNKGYEWAAGVPCGAGKLRRGS